MKGNVVVEEYFNNLRYTLKISVSSVKFVLRVRTEKFE